MRANARVEILPMQASQAGATLFSSPQQSDETLIASIGIGPTHEIFCHRRQTDQLMVLRGAVDLVVIENRRLRRIPMTEDSGTWVRIPPGVPHGAINRGSQPALMVNAVKRHGASDPRDYRPLPIPLSLQQDWIALLNNPG